MSTLQKNEQYSYTNETELLAGITEKNGWLPIKNGLTLRDTVTRVKEQDIASTTAELIVLNAISTYSNDIKLDDKIRDIIHETKNFQNYVRNDDKSNEWSWVKISDIIKKLKIPYDKTLLVNSEFLELLSNRIGTAKKLAIKQINNKPAGIVVNLRTQQEYVLQEMLKANKKYNLLNLAPRFGKTFLILELMQELSKIYPNLVLVIASKNLSSNASFESSYNEVATYDFELVCSSLFVDGNIMMDRLSDVIGSHHNVVVVTDEADVGSHTEISVTKLDTIDVNHNVIKNIVMSGTNINTANKIIRQKSTEDNTYECNMNYTDMMEITNGVNMVRRNFWDIRLTMEKDDEILNIQQSFGEPKRYPRLVNYIDQLTTKNEEFENINGRTLCEANVVMVFVNTATNKDLKSFKNFYAEAHPEVITDIITSETTTNGEAEKRVKRLIKKNPNKKIVLFSRQMASRSFSIPEINRVIIMKDGFISGSDYQKMSRCLTFENGKTDADIIRVSYQNIGLAENMFLIENAGVLNDNNDTQLQKGKRFFHRFNTFATFEISELGVERAFDTTLAQMIDKLMKFADEKGFVKSKLYDMDLILDETLLIPTGSDKNVSSSSATKDPEKPEKPEKPNTENPEKSEKPKGLSDTERLRMIDTLTNVIRVMPYILNIMYNTKEISFANSISDETFLEVFKIQKFLFTENMKKVEFSDLVESIFRNTDFSEDNIDEKLMAFCV